jgi:hypothetical protein
LPWVFELVVNADLRGVVGLGDPPFDGDEGVINVLLWALLVAQNPFHQFLALGRRSLEQRPAEHRGRNLVDLGDVRDRT